ncbi:MAG: hypothetical protein CXZ00_15535 [Acidobacteria bacterium]|nr:MAG: hypothetical protein CXZ00_15535 [Acidobacteriota bacterium]
MLLEVLIAIIIFTVALLGLAALMLRVSAGTERSRYMSIATMLASEKLEDLIRYPSTDPVVYVPPSSVLVGGLAADKSELISCSGVTENVIYYDDVRLSVGEGVVTEVRTATDGSGNPCYYVFKHTASGAASEGSCLSAAPAVPSGTLVFHRRWMIESPVTVNTTSVANIRRITVLVKLPTSIQGGDVSFQMSALRP